MPTKPTFRIDHAMIRVSDLDKSLDFYTRILGMEVLRKSEYPEGKFTNVFVGHHGDGAAKLELTYNWEQDEPYERGTAWGHIALTVDDLPAAGAYLKAEGVVFIKEPSPMKHGTRMIAFVKDPDGYPIELIESM